MLGLRYGIDCTGLLLSRLLAYFLTGIYNAGRDWAQEGFSVLLELRLDPPCVIGTNSALEWPVRPAPGHCSV